MQQQYYWIAGAACLLLSGLAFLSNARAHDTQAGQAHHARLIPIAVESNIVSIRSDGQYLHIDSNGIPDHVTGQFPNRNNPNAIASQSHQYRVVASPEQSGHITPMHRQPFGVALNGIPFDPATAECYGQPRGRRPSAKCEWNEEAIVGSEGKLGLDSSNAHVQPTGAYHYHGIPNGLVKLLPGDDLVHVGYAADGFKILASRSGHYQPSYQLKRGSRPSGASNPGGQYDGTYTQDYEFIQGSGRLDECNGAIIDGQYSYLLTEAFPFIPRCWKGTPDESFARRIPGAGRGNMRDRNHPDGRPAQPRPDDRFRGPF